MNRPTTHIQRHQGSVLIVSMLILLVLTLIGVTAMGTSSLEEKMAGNSRDRDLAFQSSEAALRDAETFIGGIAAVGAFNNSNGLYATGAAPDITLAATWTGTASRTATGTLAGVKSQPRYIIEMASVSGTVNPSAEECYECPVAQGPVTNLRVTVRGTGGTDSAVVMLQAYYARMF